jgi:hypothetical protein
MHDRVLLVDFENVHKLDLALIPSDVVVLVFFGASQKSVTREFHKAARQLGERCVEIDIHGQGKNALDFHLAFYLGEYLAKAPSAELIILSKDKGFDPLIHHLCERKFNVRRANSQAEAFPAKATVAGIEARVQRMFDVLRKMEKNARPRKRKGLLAHIANHFKDASVADVEKLVEQLFADGRVGEANGALIYKL